MIPGLRRYLFAVFLFLIAVSLNAADGGDKRDSSLVLVGDTQRTGFWERLLFREQNDGARESVMRRIAEENPGLVVILGDLTSVGGDGENWSYFDQFTAPVRQCGTPIVPVFGNHEYFGNRDRMYAAMFSRFPLLRGQLWTVIRFHSIAVVILNSNFAELTTVQVQEQNAWYKAQLVALEADRNVRAIVVCCHHPPFTNSTIVSPSEEVQQFFVRPFMAFSKTVLFASGHCHSYEHFIRQGKHFLVTGGGGGPRQRVETDPHRRRFEDVYSGSGIRDFHFCKLTLGEGRLRISMMRMNDAHQTWTVGDDFSLP